MQYQCAMLVVKDIKKSTEFYTQLLKLDIVYDLGTNVTLAGGLALQIEDSWIQFTNSKKESFTYKGNRVEFYFEEVQFDKFIAQLTAEGIELLGDVIITPWEQRVVRFYDPDKHIIQVGENFVTIVKRLHQQGMNVDEIAKKILHKKEIVEQMLKNSL